MKIPTDVLLKSGNEYCIKCFHTPIETRKDESGKFFVCPACGHEDKRRLSTGDSIIWRLDEERNMWHESVGIFLFNPQKKILFFGLTKFPYGLTIPAGHLNEKEEPESAMRRELKEETNLEPKNIKLLAVEDIEGDPCSRGADSHRWHAFVADTDSTTATLDSSEGKNPVWLNLEEALNRDLASPVRLLINKHKDKLIRLASVKD